MIKSILDVGYPGATIAVLLLIQSLHPELLMAQAKVTEVGQPAIQYFSPRTYGAPNQNFGLAQDEDGVMYFANRSGVLEYDGARWRLSRSPDDRTVWAVVPFPGGPVLAAGDGFIAVLGEIGQEDMVSIRFVDGEIRSGVRHDSTVYFTDATAIHTWRREEGFSRWKQGTAFGRVFSVAGKLYVHDIARGLLVKEDDMLVPIPGGERFKEQVIFALMADGGRGLIVGSQEGLHRQYGSEFRPWSTEADALLAGTETSHAILLPDSTIGFGSNRGLVVIDRDGRLLRHIDDSSGLQNELVERLLVDRQQGLWLAHQNGISRLEFPTSITRFNDVALQGAESIVRHSGRLYVSTRTGLMVLDPVRTPGRAASFRQLGGVTTECYGLLSVPEALLAACEAGVYALDGPDGAATLVRPSRAAIVLTRSRTHPDVVWVGEADGMGRLRLRNGRWSDDGSLAGTNGFVRHLEEDVNGHVWLATRLSGVQRIRYPAYEEPEVETLGPESGLPDGRLRVFRVDDGILIATRDGLYSVQESGHVVPDSTFDVGVVSRLVQAGNRDVWMVSDRGIARFRAGDDGKFGRAEYPFRSVTMFDTYALYPESTGISWAGGAESLYRYDEHAQRTFDSGFDTLLRGVIVIPGDSALAVTSTPVLAYDRNSLRMSFATARFNDVSGAEYRTFLDGYDVDWSTWSTRSDRDILRLREGTYQFLVQGRDPSGVLGSQASFTFRILPPWWRTSAAYVLYLVLFFGLTATVDRFRRTRIERRERVRASISEAKLRASFAEQRADDLKQMNDSRSRFFTSISHEYRTPLTLIMGPLEDLMERSGPELAADAREDISMALRNVGRLTHLTNQLLDIARLESGQLTLSPTVIDMGAFVQEMKTVFQSAADKKRLSLLVDVADAPVASMVDPEHMEKVFFNLLANAVKYTPPGGVVRMAVVLSPPGYIRITVANSNAGVTAEDVPRLFERFFRSRTARDGGGVGTGIGLSIVKDLVELHGGTVHAEADVHGTLTITVRLERVDGDAIPGTIHVGSLTALLESFEEDRTIPDTVLAEDTAEDRPCVLIVEDNAELRQLIARRLRPRFRVAMASDGLDGLAKARSVIPDLVISDVMMPGMDGYELCSAMKHDDELAFIPVILLTALSSVEDRISGQEGGADAFLSKPFNDRELEATVDRLLRGQQRLRAVLAERDGSVPAPATTFADVEDAMQHDTLMRSIDHGLHDEDFSVDVIAAGIDVSRATLYRMTTKLTGMSPAALLRQRRLDKAASLIAEQAGNIGEVAYSVGFKSVSHFTQAFREQFGHTPSQHRGNADEDAKMGRFE
ncbi:MAG: response regulator [Rhodothermales bacterium]